jgi:hypothetical protein
MLVPGDSRCTGGDGVPDALQIGIYLIGSICRRWRRHDGCYDLSAHEEEDYLIYIYIQGQDALVFRVGHYQAIICQMNRSRFGG